MKRKRKYIEDIEAMMKMEIPLIEDLPEAVEFSNVYSEEEKPVSRGKNYLKSLGVKKRGEAFHKKKDKNMKVNLGGKHKKTGGKKQSVNRTVLKNRARKKK
jgi:ATP-dependent RNA helicase RhlE